MKLKFSGKTSDMCSYTLLDDEGENLRKGDGYVPSGLGIGGGDYVSFELDLKTGKIVNFKPMTDDQVNAALDED